jgi:hypothetical protein
MKQLFTRFSIVSALAFLTLGVSCASTEQTETLLSEAGFRTVIATDLPQAQLRPYKVTVTEGNRESYYAYADPARNQVYVGNQSQYQRYRQLKRELEHGFRIGRRFRWIKASGRFQPVRNMADLLFERSISDIN